MWDGKELIGCGALKFLDKEHGEFKSIRVEDKFRGKGNGIKVIKHLIDEGVWNWNKPHHLLGCSLAREFRYYIDNNIYR